MKVRELMEFLKGCNPESDVFCFNPSVDGAPVGVRTAMTVKELVMCEKNFMVEDSEPMSEEQFTIMMNEIEEEFLNFKDDGVVMVENDD